MRPTPRLLYLALGALVLTGVALGDGSDGSRAVSLPGLILLVLLAVDLVISMRWPLRLRISGADSIFNGDTSEFSITFNHPPPASLVLRPDWPEGLKGPSELTAEADWVFPVQAKSRGKWPVAKIWASWSSRFGLLEFIPQLKTDFETTVLPDMRPVLRGEIDLAVQTTLMGQKNSNIEGEGSEFHQLRDYLPGESLRHIDWKRTARQRRLVSKETRAERNHNVILVMDNGHLMRETISGLPKIDHAINAALSTAWAAAVGGDLVGLYSYNERPGLWIPPIAGRRAFANLRQAMGGMDYSHLESNHTLGLSTLQGLLNRRSLIIVFSDFVDTTTAELMVEQIGHMGRQHLILFIALKDIGTHSLVEDQVSSLDDAARAVAASGFMHDRRVVFERLRQLGVVTLETTADELTGKLVSTYLEFKAREAA